MAQALKRKDTGTIRRMTQQIGGVGQKHRLSRAFLDGKKLHLALGSTNYMEVVGTNERSINDSEFRARLMQAGIEDAADPQKYFADPLAVCSVVYGKDPQSGEIYIPIGLRSDKVMIYPRVHHVFGGLVNVGPARTAVDIGGNSRRELREEIGLTDKETAIGQFYGIIRQGPSRIPEAIGCIPIFIGREELEERWRTSASGKFEHRNITFYGIGELPSFLEEHGTTMVPSGAAALTKFLEYHFK